MASNQENSSEGPILHLRSSDGVIFDVELAIAQRSIMIKSMTESLGEDELKEVLPIPIIKSDTLKKVIEFATHHKNDPMPEEDVEIVNIRMTEWDQKFLEVDVNTLVELIDAANYLCMKDLLELATQEISKIFLQQNHEKR